VNHEHQLVENFQDTLPTCEPGELYNVTTTTNLVLKETTFANGTVHSTFTQTGKVSAVPADGTGPTYTGQVTIWGGFNQNNQSAAGTFTFSVSLKGSDGSDGSPPSRWSISASVRTARCTSSSSASDAESDNDHLGRAGCGRGARSPEKGPMPHSARKQRVRLFAASARS
jgi:hypothetical protein